MEIKRDFIIIVILISGFIFAVSLSTLYAQINIAEGTACKCTLPIPILIPTFSSLGILIGCFVYYTMFSKIHETEKRITEDSQVLLDMLHPDEKTIIKQLVENKGEAFQSKISKVLGKVKSFRVIENLKIRGIIVKEKYGKTNKIKLNDKFIRILCS
jgi:hypothetical protein